MQRYTTKHLWRMKESEQGEFVRYEDVKNDCKIKDAMRQKLWNDYIKTQHDLKEAYKLNDNLQLRVNVLFCIVMAFGGITVGQLIRWSLGL